MLKQSCRASSQQYRPCGYNAVKFSKRLENQLYNAVSKKHSRKTSSDHTYKSHQPRGVPPSSSLISCCNTMEYTLAFSSVNTVAVFLSRPRKESRISIDGFAASSARITESYVVVSKALSETVSDDKHRQGCRPISHTRLGLLAREVGARARSRVHFVLSPLMSPCRSSCDSI
jgi:hypothetical protein